MTEERWLDLITLMQLLDGLDPADRDLMILVCGLDLDTDYDGPWPPTHVDIGQWLGRKYGVPLKDSTVRWRRDAILAMWRGERGRLRRNRRKRPEHPKKSR